MNRGFDLTGQKVIVTGAAGGIAAAAVQAMARQGAKLVLTDIVETPPYDLPEGAVWYPCDVANRDDVARLAATHPDASALLLAAGILPFDDWEGDDWDASFHKVMDVNVLGVLNMARAFVPVMGQAGSGRIVVVGSASGRMGGVVAGPHYVASKGAVHALVRWLALRAAPKGITVNGIAPGSVRSAMLQGQPFSPDKVPMGRLAEPEEIGWPIAFLCSEAATYMCGSVIDVNGGLTFS